MAIRSLNAEPLPALEPLELKRREEQAQPRLRGLGSWARGALLLDGAMLAAAAVAAQLGAGGAGIVGVSPVWLVVYGGLVLLFMRFRGMYAWRLRVSVLDDVRAVLTATALASMSLLTLRILLPGEVSDLASQSLRVLAFSAVYVAAGRVAIDWAQLKARRHGEAAAPTLIVGAGRIGALTAKRLLERPELGLQPVGFVDKEPLNEQHGIEHVVVTFSTAPSEVLLREVQRCEELGVRVSLVPRLFERVNTRLSVDHIGGLPLLSTHRTDPKGWQFAVKYLVDRLVAAFLILLVLPLLAAAALAVRFSVGAPVLFRQRRVGLDGREFDMLKLRTMRGAASHGEADVDWAQEQLGEPIERVEVQPDRTTRVGRLLRALSIDELPQLVNVLRGDMSLVGPRPERSHYVERFERNVYRYGDRHRVKSGITGWAQVHGLRGKTSLSDRVEWDNYYIENWSLWLDFKVLLLTFLAVIHSPRHVE